jgi:hypothetical protein
MPNDLVTFQSLILSLKIINFVVFIKERNVFPLILNNIQLWKFLNQKRFSNPLLQMKLAKFSFILPTLKKILSRMTHFCKKNCTRSEDRTRDLDRVKVAF